MIYSPIRILPKSVTFSTKVSSIFTLSYFDV